MTKPDLLQRIEKGGYTKEQLLGWTRALPGSSHSRTPTELRTGDVFMHPVFKHPYILLKKDREEWICGLLTSEKECPEILAKCSSRFFAESFITKTIFKTTEVTGSFLNPYNNPRHLHKVLQQLKTELIW